MILMNLVYNIEDDTKVSINGSKVDVPLFLMSHVQMDGHIRWLSL
jgi:hypothetical protein